MMHRAELDALEAEHQAAIANLEAAHARVTATAAAVDQFWNRVHLAEAANGEVLAW